MHHFNRRIFSLLSGLLLLVDPGCSLSPLSVKQHADSPSFAGQPARLPRAVKFEVDVTPEADEVGHSTFVPRGAAVTLKRLNGFMKSTTKDPYRLAHATVGSLSLLWGSHHMYEVCIAHDFAHPIDQATILWSGTLHSLCGLLSLRRLDFDIQREFARNSMIWPVPFQNMWFLVASLSSWGLGPEKQLFPLENGGFQLFTAASLLLTAWQVCVVAQNTGLGQYECKSKATKPMQQDSIWFNESWKNAALVEVVYSFQLQIQMGLFAYIALSRHSDSFAAFQTQHPEIAFLMANVALNSAFIGNLLVFLATLVRYKLVSKPNTNSLVLFGASGALTSFTLCKILATFFSVDEGAMSSDFVSALL